MPTFEMRSYKVTMFSSFHHWIGSVRFVSVAPALRSARMAGSATPPVAAFVDSGHSESPVLGDGDVSTLISSDSDSDLVRLPTCAPKRAAARHPALLMVNGGNGFGGQVVASAVAGTASVHDQSGSSTPLLRTIRPGTNVAVTPQAWAPSASASDDNGTPYFTPTPSTPLGSASPTGSPLWAGSAYARHAYGDPRGGPTPSETTRDGHSTLHQRHARGRARSRIKVVRVGKPRLVVPATDLPGSAPAAGDSVLHGLVSYAYEDDSAVDRALLGAASAHANYQNAAGHTPLHMAVAAAYFHGACACLKAACWTNTSPRGCGGAQGSAP